MYLLPGLSSTVLVLLGSYLILGMLRRVRDWSLRRTAQFSVLSMPIVILGLGICSLNVPFWDILPGVVLLLAIGVIVLGAVILGVIRLILVARLVKHRAVFTSPEMQMLANDLAQRLGTVYPQVRFCAYDRPLALTCGLVRPTVLLSTWMVEHLDKRELEAVLIHELEHVARHDYLVIWLATILRDAFFYLPTSRIAYRQIQQGKELACDDLAVGVTQRPLALASALAKVWQNAVDGPQFARIGAAQPLVEVGTSINNRIERLLAHSESKTSKQHTCVTTFRLNTTALIAFAIIQGATLIVVLALMGCNPVALLEKLL